jgi:two-component system response regulator DesR
MIRVLIAEDMHILREALVQLLSLEGDIEVVAQLATGTDVARIAVEHRPDVAVIDIDLPGKDGVVAAAEVKAQLPGCRILFLTALTRPGQLRRAFDTHVSGLLPKDVRPAELAAAIRTIAAGGRVVDPALALVALEAGENPLTQREAEVLRMSATGALPVEIAERLFLTYGTVRNYLASAVTKLGARNRVDAIRIAAESGWI